MATIKVDLARVEEACGHLLDAHDQICALVELSQTEGLLVLARVAHILEASISRASCAQDRAAFERLRAEVIARAEATRLENLAEDALGINSEGGSG